MTDLSVIYDNFLSKISDYRFLKMSDQEIEEDLFGYFKSARSRFRKCKKSLEVDGNKIEGDLSYFEIEIITALMVVEHIKPQLITSENYKQTLSDKDFKMYSQANQLREIRLLFDSLKRESSKMLTEYTFIDLTEERM